jgi:hypothetical protein
MGFEIERKFLVRGGEWQQIAIKYTEIRQAYLYGKARLGSGSMTDTPTPTTHRPRPAAAAELHRPNSRRTGAIRVIVGDGRGEGTEARMTDGA